MRRKQEAAKIDRENEALANRIANAKSDLSVSRMARWTKQLDYQASITQGTSNRHRFEAVKAILQSSGRILK